MDFTELNKLFLKRNNIYREYLFQLISCNDKESFENKAGELLDDAKDDIATWNETLTKSNFQVPSIVEKTWENLYKNICYTINISANIRVLRGF